MDGSRLWALPLIQKLWFGFDILGAAKKGVYSEGSTIHEDFIPVDLEVIFWVGAGRNWEAENLIFGGRGAEWAAFRTG